MMVCIVPLPWEGLIQAGRRYMQSINFINSGWVAAQLDGRWLALTVFKSQNSLNKIRGAHG